MKGWRTVDSSEDFKILKEAMKEMTSLQSVLVIPNAISGYRFTSPNPAIHVALIESTDATYLIVANDSRGPETAALKLDKFGDAIATNLADSTTIKRSDGNFPLQLAPLAAGVYRIEPAR